MNDTRLVEWYAVEIVQNSDYLIRVNVGATALIRALFLNFRIYTSFYECT